MTTSKKRLALIFLAVLIILLILLGILLVPPSRRQISPETPPQTYTLTITHTTGGTTNPAPGNYTYLENTTVTVNATASTGYVFNHWELDGSSTGSDNPITVTMDANHTLLAVFEELPLPKYYLTVISPYGTPGGEGWYDECTTTYATLNTSIVDHGNGTRRVFTHWSGDASGTDYSTSDPIHMDKNKTAVANWKTQYYLTVTSPYDAPTPTSGWFDGGTLINASVTSPWPGPTGTQYVCTGWTGTGSIPAFGTTKAVTFTIDAPSNITWTWKTQYYLTVKTDPTGLNPAPTPPSGWYNESTHVELIAQHPSYKDSVEYSFEYWDVDGTNVNDNPITVHMDMPHTATAHYQEWEPPPTPPTPVGGYALPIDKINSPAQTMHLTPQIGLAFALLAAIAATILLTKRRSKTIK